MARPRARPSPDGHARRARQRRRQGHPDGERVRGLPVPEQGRQHRAWPEQGTGGPGDHPGHLPSLGDQEREPDEHRLLHPRLHRQRSRGRTLVVRTRTGPASTPTARPRDRPPRWVGPRQDVLVTVPVTAQGQGRLLVVAQRSETLTLSISTVGRRTATRSGSGRALVALGRVVTVSCRRRTLRG